ncbi:MAG: hypothetical protein HYZ27_00880, partial [Deltaproteobacteria bacterium]|nr:hypothetical protein [Deltaproteobacteria bacterium]
VPDIPLYRPPPAPFVAPGRLFAVQVPSGWGVALHDRDPYTIDFRAADRPGEAVIQVRRMLVPSGAHPRQLMLNAIEQRLRKLPNFKVIMRRDILVAGGKGASVLGSYAYQGNIQFPRVVEEVYMVLGNEAFVLHFECFEPAAAAFALDLERFYGSFQPRPPAEMPFGRAEPEQGSEIPF